MSTSVLLQPEQAGSSSLTPRERMRLLKQSLLNDEDQEAANKKEARKARRGSHIPNSPRKESSASISTPSSYRDRPPPASGILRKPSTTQIPLYIATTPADLPPSPSSSFVTLDSATSALQDFNPSLSSDAESVRRRSSRVRFSQDTQASGENDDEDDTPTPSQSLNSQKRKIKRKSSIEALRAELDRARNSISSTTSASSGSSSGGSPILLQQQRLSILSNASSLEEAFAVQPLPYPKMSTRLSRLSTESDLSNTSNRSSVSEKPIRPPRSDLRKVLQRPSISIDLSLPSSISDISPAPRSAPLPVIPRTPISPAGAGPGTGRRSTSASYGSLVSAMYSHSSSGSVSASTNSSFSYGLPTGPAYAALLPTYTYPEGEEPPTPTRAGMNRQEWVDVAGGLSPRSTVCVNSPQQHRPRKQSQSHPESKTELEPIVTPSTNPPSIGTDYFSIAEEIIGPASPPLSPKRSSIITMEDNFQNVRHHSRSGSTLSVDINLSFPLPPDRNGNSAPPQISRKSSAALIPEIIEIQSPIKEASVEIENTSPSPPREGTPEFEGVPMLGAFDDHLLIGVQGSPCPDNWSLTDAIKGIGKTTEDEIREGSGSLVRPRSPGVKEIMEGTPKIKKIGRFSSSSEEDEDGDQEEESDLDITSSLAEVAVRSKILSPKSRLLSKMPGPKPAARRVNSLGAAALKSGLAFTDKSGWVGSDSEEEEYFKRVKELRITSSKSKVSSPSKSLKMNGISSQPTSPTRAASLHERWRAGQSTHSTTNSRISTLSTSTSTSTSVATDILTPVSTPAHISIAKGHQRSWSGSSFDSPSLSSSGGSSPGKYPWGKSSPRSSPNMSPGATTPTGPGISANTHSNNSFYNSILSSSKASPSLSLSPPNSLSKMPKPKRDIPEWGPPEVLLGDDWLTWTTNTSSITKPLEAASLGGESPRTISLQSISGSSTDLTDEQREADEEEDFEDLRNISIDDITPRPPFISTVPNFSPISSSSFSNAGRGVEDWLMAEQEPHFDEDQDNEELPALTPSVVVREEEMRLGVGVAL